ncbi:hypothetical protein DRN69_03925 [Candidatus Pacearchaeota archaeon]|nr:MAG: hypothetical protein DRN69_03925 [Candidatus Pacearchaeota archaeon]
MRKIGVGKLVDLLFKKDFAEIIPEWYVRTGRLLHTKFGYQQNIMFARYHVYEGEAYLILGTPDLIEEDTIIEFKVAFSPRTVMLQKRKGEIQANIYCWLSNFPFFRCDVYSYRENRLIYGEKKRCNEELAVKTVNLALELLNEYTKYLVKRRKLLMENGLEYG